MYTIVLILFAPFSLMYRLAHPDSGRSFPFTTTLLSEPISSGSFTLVVPSSKVPRRTVLPVTSPSLKHPAAGDEVLLREYLTKSKEWGQRHPQTEIPLKAAITSDFYESHFQQSVHKLYAPEANLGPIRVYVVLTLTFFVLSCCFSSTCSPPPASKSVVDSRGMHIFQKEPTCFARNFKAALKRLKKDGWEKDQVAVFNLAGYGPQERNPKATFQPISGLGVSGNYTFDLELLSEEDAQLPK